MCDKHSYHPPTIRAKTAEEVHTTEDRRILSLGMLIVVTTAVLLFVTFLPSPASAYSISTRSDLPADTPLAGPGNANESREVHQGGPYSPWVIYWNETIDMSYIEGFNAAVQRGQGTNGTNIVDISSWTHRIFIDPEVFPAGTWYQWTPNDEGPTYNDIVFRVVAEKPDITSPLLTLNGTLTCVLDVYGTVNCSNTSPTTGFSLIKPKEPPLHLLPYNPVSDVVVAQGWPVMYNDTTLPPDTTAWLFSRSTYLYDVPLEPYSVLDPDSGNASETGWQFSMDGTATAGMSAGDYNVVFDSPGVNGFREAGLKTTTTPLRYELNNITYETQQWITSPMKATPDLDITSKSPQVVYAEFVPWLKQYSDDGIREINIRVMPPVTEVVRINNIYDQKWGYALQILGYTPVSPGTRVWAVMDESKQEPKYIRKNTWYGMVNDTGMGNLSEFAINAYIDYDNTAVGQHDFTIHVEGTDLITTAPFYVYNLPDGEPMRNKTLRYVDGNLWEPTPTPEIVERVVTLPSPTPQIVERVIVKEVEKKLPWYMTWPYPVLIGGLIGAIGVYVIWRSRKRRK